MATTLTLSTPNTPQQPQMWTRAQWGSPWVPWVRPVVLSCSETLGRSIGEAEIVHRYGLRVDNDTAPVTAVAPINIRDHWVRIEWEDTYVSGVDSEEPVRKWIGFVTDETTELDQWTYPTGVGVSIPTGVQKFRAMSIEWILTRQQIYDCYVLLSPGQPATKMKCAPAFNASRGDSYHMLGIGNQANVLDSNGKRSFDNTLSNPRQWNALEILRYLLHFFNPFGLTLTWNVTGGAVNDLAAFIPLNVEQYGRTLFDIINQLVDPRRGLVWSTRLRTATDTIELIIDSTSKDPVTITGASFTLAANDRQVDLITSGSARGTTVVSYSSQRQYEQVVAEGGRIGIVQTHQLTEDYRDWTDTDIVNYHSGASGIAGYSALDREQKKNANDTLRSQDPALSRVYNNFKVPLSGNQFTVPGRTHVGAPIGPREAVWTGGVQVEQFLPYQEGWDYTSSPAVPTNPTGNLLPALAAVKVGTKWVDGAKLGVMSRSETASGGLAFSLDVSPTESLCGFAIRPSLPAHVMGSPTSLTGHNPGVNVFEVDVAAPSDYAPQICWTDIQATIYITTAERLRVWYPDTSAAARHDHTSVLFLRYGDRARLDIAEGSPIYRVDGGNTYAAFNGTLRDDRAFLNVVAQSAWRWYETPRRALIGTINTIDIQLRVGQLVLSVDETSSVNAVISRIVWDFQRQTTMFYTEFADLDFEGL